MSGADMSTTRTQAVVVTAAPRRYALALIAPDPRLYLIDRSLLVGRAAGCDVELVGDTAASRAHARLVPGPQGVEVIGFRCVASTSPVHADAGQLSRSLLDEMLRRHAGNLRRVSQEIGIARTRLYRLLKQWSLDPAE